MTIYRRMINSWSRICRQLGNLALLILVSSCRAVSPSPVPTEVANFVPPTANPALEQRPGSAATPLPTKQSNCLNQLEFLDDLTFPDGTEVQPGEKITKRWLIKNTGTCNWNSSYSVQLISGLALGVEKIQGLYPARQSTKAILEINFSAPDNPGRYNSWWQAYDPDGNRFGDPFYIEISVVEQLAEEG